MWHSDPNTSNIICNEKVHDYSELSESQIKIEDPSKPEPELRPRPPIIEPIPIEVIVPIAPPCPPGEFCI